MKESEPRYSLLSASRWTVVLAIALATADNFADPDLWMHILTGQAILATGHIPRFDVYSYSAASLPWHNHEWLAQVMLAVCFIHLGVVGLKLLKITCAAVTIIAMAIGISATGAPARVQRIVLILAAVALATQMQFRPQLFTFMLLSVVMAALALEIYRGSARLWPLIPMFALWANLHGGYAAGLGAMGIAAAVFLLQRRYTSARRLAIVTLACAAATLLNPFGVGLWTGVMHSVSDPLIRQIVNDWVPLPKALLSMWRDSKQALLQDVVPILLFVMFATTVALAPDPGDAALIAVAAVFIGGAFYAVRNVALAVIALAVPLARHAGLILETAPAAAAGAHPHVRDDPPAALLATCALAVALVGGTFSSRLQTWKPVPVAALAFMQQHDLHGNILSQFEWGEYVAWHTHDNSRVFIDGRCELVYPDRIIRQYAVFFYGLDGADQILDAYPHDFVLINPHTKAFNIVSKDPRWQTLYLDATAALFKRTSTPAPTAVKIPQGKPVDTYFP